MKALLRTVLLGTLAFAGLKIAVHQHDESVAEQKRAALEKENAERPGPGGLGSTSPGEPRKFDLDLQTIRPHGEAIAQAAFYDISPGTNTSPEKLPPAQSARTQAGQIYITGLPEGLIDGQHQLIWLTRAGTKTYADPRGGVHTIPAYKVAPAPPAIVSNKPVNGAWMYEGATALDQRTKANGLR